MTKFKNFDPLEFFSTLILKLEITADVVRNNFVNWMRQFIEFESAHK
jgi:hypothetical protein